MGVALILFFVSLELAALVVGVLGVVHTKELGGRLAGLIYGITTIILATIPVSRTWQVDPGLAWWHLAPLTCTALGAAAIRNGFNKPGSQKRR